MFCYVTWRFTSGEVERKRLVFNDDEEQLRRLYRGFDHVGELFRSWAESCGGTFVYSAGPEGCVKVPADRVADAEDLRARGSTSMDMPLVLGVGMKQNESSDALKSAEEHGKTFKLYDGDEVKKAEPDAPKMATGEHSQGEAAKATFAAHPAPSLKQKFDEHADKQEMADKLDKARSQETVDALKQKVAAALKGLQSQGKDLERLRAESPKVYQSIDELTRTVIDMARGLGEFAKALPDGLDLTIFRKVCQLEAEIEAQGLAKRQLPMPKAPTRRDLHLPVGTAIESTQKIKVKLPSGKTSWKSVRAGMVMAPDGNPTSSRRPGG